MKTEKANLCKYCVVNGQPRSYGHLGAMVMTENELFDHIEQDHDIPIIREGETRKQCLKRFHQNNKRAGTDKCQCPSCDNSVLFKI